MSAEVHIEGGDTIPSFEELIKTGNLFQVMFEEIEETATRLTYIERQKRIEGKNNYPSMMQIVDEYCRVKGEGEPFKKGVAFGLLLVLQQREAVGSDFRAFLAAKKRLSESDKISDEDQRKRDKDYWSNKRDEDYQGYKERQKERQRIEKESLEKKK